MVFTNSGTTQGWFSSKRVVSGSANNNRWFVSQSVVIVVFILVSICSVVLAQSNVKTNFACQGRPSGYYADVDSGCQIYHMCDGLGRQFSYSCPNTTLFQQRMLICDHWYMVNCSKSEDDYAANLLIGQRDQPFVSDSAEHPYHRTPRPDLLAHPSASEYNIIYRTGRAGAKGSASQNLVGGESDEDEDSVAGPAYFLPSHWSTEYKRDGTTVKPRRSFGKEEKQEVAGSQKKSEFQSFRRTEQPRKEFNGLSNSNDGDNSGPKRKQVLENSRVRGSPQNLLAVSSSNEAFNEIKTDNSFKRIDSDISKTIPVNFKSTFRATTPVYPTFVEESAPLATLEDTDPANNDGLKLVVLPPSSGTPNSQTVPPIVNFRSDFKATTPVYPHVLDDETRAKNEYDFGQLTPGEPENDANKEVPVVNFHSDFKATTPVYPQFVDPKHEYDFGQLLPFTRQDLLQQKPSSVNFESNFRATTPVYPNFVDPAIVAKQADNFGQEPPRSNANDEVVINFKSNFPATTPVYPKSVDPSVHLAGGGTFIGVAEGLAETIVPPRPSDIPQPQQPSLVFQPPGFSDRNGERLRLAPQTDKQWKDLRTMFLIPDYDFPLESIARPAYESTGPNSFQVNQFVYTSTASKKR